MARPLKGVCELLFCCYGAHARLRLFCSVPVCLCPAPFPPANQDVAVNHFPCTGLSACYHAPRCVDNGLNL